MLCDYMLFKSNHYYKVTHSVSCIIKTIRKLGTITNDELWEVEIIKIINNNNCNIPYRDGQITNWYKNWCYDIVEIKNINDNAEILALVL